MELVGSFSVPSTSRQFAPIAAKVREVNPDAVYIAYFGQTMVALVKQLRDNGVDKMFVSYSAFNDPDMIALPGAEGSVYSSQKMDWDSKDPITARFVADFKKKYNKTPSFYNANYYNAVWVTGRRWRAWRRTASRSPASRSATSCSRSRPSTPSAARWNSSPTAPSRCRCRSTS